MNYAIAFLAAILAAALIYWYAGGRRWYTGPLVETEVADDSSGTESHAPEKAYEATHEPPAHGYEKTVY